MHSETGGPGEERPVQLAAKAPADGDGDGDGESPPSGGHGERKTGRRWIVITAAGVAAFAALLTAITTTASTLYNLDRRPIATRPASPRRTGAVSTPAPRPGPRSPGSIAGTPATTASPGTGGPAAPTPSGPPAPSAPSAGQGANAGGSSPSVRTPRAQVTRSPSPPATGTSMSAAVSQGPGPTGSCGSCGLDNPSRATRSRSSSTTPRVRSIWVPGARSASTASPWAIPASGQSAAPGASSSRSRRHQPRRSGSRTHSPTTATRNGTGTGSPFSRAPASSARRSSSPGAANAVPGDVPDTSKEEA